MAWRDVGALTQLRFSRETVPVDVTLGRNPLCSMLNKFGSLQLLSGAGVVWICYAYGPSHVLEPTFCPWIDSQEFLLVVQHQHPLYPSWDKLQIIILLFLSWSPHRENLMPPQQYWQTGKMRVSSPENGSLSRAENSRRTLQRWAGTVSQSSEGVSWPLGKFRILIEIFLSSSEKMHGRIPVFFYMPPTLPW